MKIMEMKQVKRDGVEDTKKMIMMTELKKLDKKKGKNLAH